jgi:hypothetical protein
MLFTKHIITTFGERGWVKITTPDLKLQIKPLKRLLDIYTMFETKD